MKINIKISLLILCAGLLCHVKSLAQNPIITDSIQLSLNRYRYFIAKEKKATYFESLYKEQVRKNDSIVKHYIGIAQLPTSTAKLLAQIENLKIDRDKWKDAAMMQQETIRATYKIISDKNSNIIALQKKVYKQRSLLSFAVQYYRYERVYLFLCLLAAVPVGYYLGATR